MKALFPYIASLPILLTSCTSLMSEINKLHPGENASLVKRCAKMVERMPETGSHPISRADKIFVKTHEPKFHATYTGYKTGTFRMSWKINPSYVIIIEGKGKMTDEKCPVKLVVHRFVR